MTAGTEVVCNDIVRKVEIEEKRVAGLDISDLNEVGAVDVSVGGNGIGNVGRDGKEETDDSSYVFVNGSVEVAAGDPGDTGGVNVDDVSPKSVSAEVDQYKKVELGIENGGIPVDPLVMETDGIVHEPATAKDAEVKAVKDVVNLDNGSAVDTSVVLETNDIGQAVNGHLGKITGEEETIVEITEEGDTANGITNVEAKMADIVSGVTFDSEPAMNTIESSQVLVFESESALKPSEESKSQATITQSLPTPDVNNSTDESLSTPNPVRTTEHEVMINGELESESSKSEVRVTQSLYMPDVINTTDELLSTPNPVRNTDCEVMVKDEPKSIITLADKAGCQVTADASGKSPEDLECQVTAEGSESSGSLIEEREGQVTVDGSSMPSEDLESQVTADVPESCGSPVEARESKVSGDGSESIDSIVDNQECPVSVDGSECSGNHTEEVVSNTIVMESDRKSEEHKELLIMTPEINVEAEPNHVCSGIKAEHQSESVSAPYPSENKKAEETVIGSGTESEEKLDSGLVLSEDADALAIGQVQKFDEILEMGETQISLTEADGNAPLLFDAEKANPEEKLEKQVEGSSETLFKITESVEMEVNSEEMMEQVKIEDEIRESQMVVIENVQDDLNLEDNTAESANEAEVPLETEITNENTASQDEVNRCIDKPQEGSQPEGSAENVEILPSIDPGKSECNNNELLVEKDNDLLSNPDDLTVVEQKAEFVPHLDTENRSAAGMDCETGIENVEVPDDEGKETEVKDAPVEDHSTLSFPDTYVNPVTVIEFGSIGRHETIPNLHNDDVISEPDVANGDTKPACGADSDYPERNINGSHGDRNSDKMSGPEAEDIDGIQNDEIPTSSVEGSVSDAIEVQNEEAEVLTYNFLIRIPRFEDEMFRDQIRSAQLQVEEKTRLRDAIRVEIQGKRARLKAHNEAFNAARSEETAARRLVRLKRQEIDSVQSVINRVKNAMSIEDIDGRIYNMEHMIQHETLCLKDEKQFIREIKQLKTLRDQLASSMGSKEEVRQAIDQKEQNEERMKILRKELDSLKDKVSKAEAAVIAVGKKYDEESRKERELQAQFRAADDVRQKAYAHLNSLKKQSYDKNKNFRLYKEDVMAARDFASRGDKDALHRLCANQVEAFMEQWNNSDEFRKDYVRRCTMNASRRQRMLDGGSHVPDDVAPVHPSNVNGKADKSQVSIPIEAKSVSVVSAVEDKQADDKCIENVTGQKNQSLKTKGVEKPTLGSDVATVTENDEAIEKIKEEENIVTKEEIELARKAEELRKEEEAAKLKEQRRLEEKAKAAEALERKKRNAEKAQIRAELRARKEAEQKEKEREKRLRKKEKKRAGCGDGSMNGEDAASSESSNEATTNNNKEIEAVNNNNNNNTMEKSKKKAHKPPAHYFSKQLKPKPVPPPIANRNKKRWQQWGKLALVALAILALFLLGNTGFFLNLKVGKSSGPI